MARVDRDDLLRAPRRTCSMNRNDHRFPPRHVPRARRRRGDLSAVRERTAPIRIEFFGDEIDAIAEIDPLRGKVHGAAAPGHDLPRQSLRGYHRRSDPAVLCDGIKRGAARSSLEHIQQGGQAAGGPAASSSARMFDHRNASEQMGFCHGVENYSRWLDGRAPGEAPYTLHDYFPG